MSGEERALRVIEGSGTQLPGCPKHMVYGPCGGVRADEACEIDDRRCPFTRVPLARWAGPEAAPSGRAGDLAAGGPLIVTDLRVRPYDRRSIADVTQRLSVHGDAVLVGEHSGRPDFPPTTMATTVLEAGGRPWVTLSCRDRNRVVLEGELEALATIGPAGVHCVTGDARAASVRPDATQVFDLDSVRLAALARRHDLTVSVAATPAAPPFALRPDRVVEKQRAGADVCFVNHAGGPDVVGTFVGAARAAGATLAFIPCVAVFTDVESLDVLHRFPGLVVDPAEIRRVMESPDVREAGIAAAVDQAARMLDIDGVVGVNLSGSATSGPELESAAIMADVAARLRARLAGAA